MGPWNPARGATVGVGGLGRSSAAAKHLRSEHNGRRSPEHNGCEKSGLVRGGVKRDQAGKVVLNRYSSIQVILHSAWVSPAKG